jgi:TyrR family helix-turn-helix protein
VRIVSATHRDLAKMVAEGTFREDLYYRLNVLNIEVPPLRERGDDILLLARHFIERACAQARKPVCRLNAAASGALLANAWPGNVRQLQNVVFRAVTMTDALTIDAADLDLAENSIMTEESAVPEVGDHDDWESAVARFERALLERLYAEYPSSRKLAQRLKTSHSMVATKLRKYGIGRSSG